MDEERQNFVYGNEEQGVEGCIANEESAKQAANKIYDDMMDFAKYAFNKSHAAAYAVVSYQTAYLKYYYPVEFMAALHDPPVMDEPDEGLRVYPCLPGTWVFPILPPDINEGVQRDSPYAGDSASATGSAAIKSRGRSRRGRDDRRAK